MLDIIIPSFMIMVLITIIFIKFQLEYRKNKTKLSYYASIIFTCFGLEMGCSYGNIILMSLTGISIFVWYKYVYIISFSLITLSIVISSVFIFRLYELSGHKAKFGFLKRLIYYFLVIFLSAFNGLTLNQINLEPYGFYLYQMDIILIIMILIIYIPYSIILTIIYYKSIITFKKRRISLPMHIQFLITSIFSITRFSFFGFYVIFPDSTGLLVINIISVSLLLLELYMIFKYPNFAEVLGIYFSVKSLYIILKTGRTLFTYNFKKFESKEEDLVYSDTFMIGGFISSLGNGLKKAIQLEGVPSLIDIGDYKLMFKYGKFVIGVLLITAVNQKLKSKLDEFISKFEEDYESKDIELDRLIHEHEEELNNLVSEIFGKFIE